MNVKNKALNILEQFNIDAENRFDALLKIFSTLKKESFVIEDFDSKTVGEVLDAFSEKSNLNPLLSNLNNQILIYEIKEILELVYSPQIEPKKDDNIIDKSIELELKPEDFPEKQYDEEYMKELGLDE